MFNSGLVLGGIVAFLGAVESISWWWMHPQRQADNHPVLTYQVSRTPLQPDTADGTPQAAVYTPMPEIYQKSAPKLRCSSGEVMHVQLEDRIGLHVAYFEWDGTDTGSVLEAFRHTPEICLGSLGMELSSKEQPIVWQIDGQSLIFDHIIFREPSNGRAVGLSQQVHTFRTVWVEGADSIDYREGIMGDPLKRLGPIRLKSALSRYRPAHARVIQGAVRGVPNGTAAWEVFEKTVLKDLKFVRRSS